MAWNNDITSHIAGAKFGKSKTVIEEERKEDKEEEIAGRYKKILDYLTKIENFKLAYNEINSYAKSANYSLHRLENFTQNGQNAKPAASVIRAVKNLVEAGYVNVKKWVVFAAEYKAEKPKYRKVFVFEISENSENYTFTYKACGVTHDHYKTFSKEKGVYLGGKKILCIPKNEL